MSVTDLKAGVIWIYLRICETMTEQIENKHFVFFGRIHPERTAFDIKLPTPLKFEVKEADLNGEINVESSASQLTIILTTPSKNDIYTMRNHVESVTRIIVDSFGYSTGRGYDVEIISVVQPNNETIVFGVEVPALAEFRKENECQAGEVINAVSKSPQLAYVLFNLREAIRQPADTGFFCFRAVECMRQTFLPNDKTDDGEARKMSWENLNEKLQTQQSFTLPLQKFALPQRHGSPKYMSDDDRKDLLLRAYRLVDRYLIYLKDGPLSKEKFEKLT